MGFAGQVFAARVAVGLAVPSPSAFSQAGAQIGKFGAKMYNTLNKQSMGAARTNAQQSGKDLSAAQARLDKHMKSQHAKMAKASTVATKTMQQNYKDLGKTASFSAGAMKTLKGSLPKPVKAKLFANVNEDMKSGKDYENLFKNFSKLTKDEQKDTLALIAAQKAQIQNLIAVAKEKGIYKGKTKKMFEDEIGYLKVQENVFTSGKNTMDKAQEKFHKNTKKYEKTRDKAAKKHKIDMKDLAELYKKNSQRIKAWGNAIGRAAGQIKQGFNEALRESIGALTAFYYKLSQNTQELITFERELKNANSVFGLTNDELFEVGETVVQFGQKFGMEMQNGAAGLYQLASAGVSANEALQILPETLKLSMAVQGDHNTISKLTAQTLFGFGMEMSQAAEVTDKFAHAIQKSLIEYQDLSSAVKFALPFFTTTGQSIDQLLGALAVLTNRALEAGIAGRGLRQGLAELAESVGDNTAAFRKMGIEVTNQQGDLLQLTEIAANFAATLEEGVINDTELLTMLIEDLNVRGATAFVHLVQASDEFTQAVKDSENAGGELDKMVKEQNTSLMAQVQILKNNVGALFIHRDAMYQSTEYLNAFHEAVIKAVESLQGLLMVNTENGYVMTEMGRQIQDIAVAGVEMLTQLVRDIIPLIKEFTEAGGLNVELLKVYLIPLQLVVKAIDLLGPGVVKLVIAYSILNKALALNHILMGVGLVVMNRKMIASMAEMAVTMRNIEVQGMDLAAKNRNNFAMIFGNKQKEKSIFLTIRETIVKYASAVASAVAAAATWLWNTAILGTVGAIMALHWATGGLILLAAALVVGLVLVIKKFYTWSEGLHTVKMVLLHIGMYLLDLAKWIATPFIVLGKAIWNLVEGPLFGFMMTIKHFFMYLDWSLRYIGRVADKYVGGAFRLIWAGITAIPSKVMWVVDAVVKFITDGGKLVSWVFNGIWSIVKFIAEGMWGLLVDLGTFTMDIYNFVNSGGAMEKLSDLATSIKDAFAAIPAFIGQMITKVKELLDIPGWSTVSGWVSGITGAEGMLVASPRYAAQGALSGGHSQPYIVGERGPEVFMPRTQGKIIPNKDLNTQRVNNMLQDAFNLAPRQGAAGIGQAQTLIVSSLNVGNADLRKTKLGVDVFG